MGGLLSTLASLNTNARRYFVMYALVMGGFFGISSVLLNLYLVRLGFGTEFVGTINGLSLAASAVTAMPAGAFGRRFGSRTAILTGLLTATMGAALIPAAGWLPAGLVAGAIVAGSLAFFSGGSLFAANWSPYLMAVIEEGDRPRLFSLRSSIQPLATLVFSLVAGVLPRLVSGIVGVPVSEPLPYRIALAFPPIFMLAAFLVMCGTDRLPPPRREPRGTLRATRLPLALIAPVAAAGLLRQGGLWVARSFYNVYMDRELGAATALIGAVAALGQLAAIPAPLLMPTLARRWGKPATVLAGTVGIAAGLFVLAAVRHWLGVAIGIATMMASFMVALSAVELFQQELVAPEWRSVVSGICLAANTLGSAIMVLSSGFLVDRLGFSGIFLIGAVAGCASALLFAAFFLRRGVQPAVA